MINSKCESKLTLQMHLFSNLCIIIFCHFCTNFGAETLQCSTQFNEILKGKYKMSNSNLNGLKCWLFENWNKLKCKQNHFGFFYSHHDLKAKLNPYMKQPPFFNVFIWVICWRVRLNQWIYCNNKNSIENKARSSSFVLMSGSRKSRKLDNWLSSQH